MEFIPWIECLLKTIAVDPELKRRTSVKLDMVHREASIVSVMVNAEANVDIKLDVFFYHDYVEIRGKRFCYDQKTLCIDRIVTFLQHKIANF